MKRLLILFIAVAATVSVHAQKKPITLEDIFLKGTFRSKNVGEFRSLKNGIEYLKTDDDSVNKATDINVYDYRSGKKTKTLLRGMDVQLNGSPLDFEEFTMSNDETKILFENESESIYRHSHLTKYYVYDLTAKKLIDLSIYGKFLLCELSPDGSRVAYVRDNNMYYRDLNSMSEHMMTHDGKKNSVINGAPDWVYEEEFTFSKGFEWSPDGNKIAFMRFDESKVKEFTLTYYDSLYPRQETYKYPKAGEVNSVVNVYVYDIAGGGTYKADAGTNTDQYIPRIYWTYDNQLCIMRMNRKQNKVDLLLADGDGHCKTFFTEEDKTYIDLDNSVGLQFLKDKTHFVWQSYKDGYNQIYLYKMDGSLEKQITTDKKDVVAYYGYDELKKVFYYQSYDATPVDALVYSVTMDGKKKLLSYPNGTNDADFSQGFKYFVLNHSSANEVPLYELYSSDGKKVRVLEDNASTKKKLDEYNFGTTEFITIPASPGVTLRAWVIKPADFNPEKKYPVLMYVYGGPAAPTVNNSFGGSRNSWYHMLAAKGYIIVSVDNRGTTKQGYDFLRCTYKQLGKLEVQDQIDAAKWLAKQPYVDGSRIGIWGWSYGGYMTALCMTKGADVFRMGISVAPVTNWRFYDTIYTERYLLTPQENASGYDDNSPINFADKLKGRYLIVAGTADDNVHYQNTMMFINKLIKSGAQFDQMSYPNRNHGIYGGGATLHLYTKMTNFITENL